MNFNISTNALVASFIWGTVGSGFIIFGWKQKEMIPLMGGIALVAISYFIGSALEMSVAGVALIVGTIWLKRRM
jgi:hypothetical protein